MAGAVKQWWWLTSVTMTTSCWNSSPSVEPLLSVRCCLWRECLHWLFSQRKNILSKEVLRRLCTNIAKRPEAGGDLQEQVPETPHVKKNSILASNLTNSRGRHLKIAENNRIHQVLQIRDSVHVQNRQAGVFVKQPLMLHRPRPPDTDVNKQIVDWPLY